MCARPVLREGVTQPEFRSTTRVVIIIIKRFTAERQRCHGNQTTHTLTKIEKMRVALENQLFPFFSLSELMEFSGSLFTFGVPSATLDS